MSAKHQSEREFHESLLARVNAAGGAGAGGGMHMTAAPTGPSKSLGALIGDFSDEPEAGARPALPAAGNQADNLPSSGTEVGVSSVNQKLPLQLIVDSPWQPRDRYDETELQLLGESLLDLGQQEPIKVRKKPDGNYELIFGHRRVRAARLIGWTDIEAIVVVLDDREAHKSALVSNENHRHLSAFEKAKAYRSALDAGFANDQAQVGRLFGCSQATVSQCLSLLKLPEPFQQLLNKYPKLFGYEHASVIKAALQHNPADIDAIVVAVEGMIDKPDMTPDQLQDVLDKAVRGPRVRTKAASPKVISDRNGNSAFSVRVRSRQIVIQVEEGVDVEQAGKHAMTALRQFAEGIEIPDK